MNIVSQKWTEMGIKKSAHKKAHTHHKTDPSGLGLLNMADVRYAVA